MRYRRQVMGPWAVVLGAVWVGVPTQGVAQEPGDSIRAELARLLARVDSLEAIIGRLQGAGQEETLDAVAALRAAATRAAQQGAPDTAGAEQEFQGRQRSLQSLNPEISLTGDIFGHVNSDDTNADNFVAREFELSVQATLD